MCVKELQSLIGLLNFACSVVLPGRAFLRRMIDLTKGVRKPYHHIRLTRQCKEDILLWLSFLNSFNGKSFFLSAKWLTSSNIKLYTDSAGSLGYPEVLGKCWFSGHWPDSWKSLNITILELFPIVLATEIWGTLCAIIALFSFRTITLWSILSTNRPPMNQKSWS